MDAKDVKLRLVSPLINSNPTHMTVIKIKFDLTQPNLKKKRNLTTNF